MPKKPSKSLRLKGKLVFSNKAYREQENLFSSLCLPCPIGFTVRLVCTFLLDAYSFCRRESLCICLVTSHSSLGTGLKGFNDTYMHVKSL